MFFLGIFVAQIILNFLLYVEFSQQLATVKLDVVPPSNFVKSKSHPRYVTTHISSVNNSRSKTNPINVGGAFSVVDKSLMSPKTQRKISEPFDMFYSHQERRLLESQPVR